MPAAYATPLSISARREQSLRELQRLEKTIQDWFAQYTIGETGSGGAESSHYATLHKTRLETLKGIFELAAKTLHANFQGLAQAAVNDPTSLDKIGTAYEECRTYDQTLVWLYRAWEYYKTRLEQRQDQTLAPLLWAADEVIWSCYRQAFISQSSLPASLRRMPAPLAFVEPMYTPATLESARPSPAALRRDANNPDLAELLQFLPVPVLCLPPWFLHSPWWLVYVAHEVGHNLYFDLGWADSFVDGMIEKCQELHLDTADVEAWQRWSAEIFADLFSVMMMGPWALRGILEVEFRPQGRMTLRNKDNLYPAAVIRMALMQRTLERLGLSPVGELGRLDLKEIADRSPATQRDYKILDNILDYALGTLGPADGYQASLEQICGFAQSKNAFGSNGTVEAWRKHLVGNPPKPTKNLQMPRLIACASLAAWASEAETPAPKLDKLAENTLQTLAQSGPPGVRALPPATGDVNQIGQQFLDHLLELGRQATE